MSVFFNPHGKPTFGIGLCDRCKVKMSLSDLYSDPNVPGLRVCKRDLDIYDPYRLAPRIPENITLEFVRPETPLTDGVPVDALWWQAGVVTPPPPPNPIQIPVTPPTPPPDQTFPPNPPTPPPPPPPPPAPPPGPPQPPALPPNTRIEENALPRQTEDGSYRVTN